MLELKEEDYIVGIWNAPLPIGRTGDFMLILYRTPKDIQFYYRFRYYLDGKSFGSQDEKSRYHGTITSTTNMEEVKRKLEQMITSAFPRYRYVEIEGNADKMADILAETDGFYMRYEPKEGT